MMCDILTEIESNKLITINQLNDLIDLMLDKFGFIKCLHVDDQSIFKHTYVKYFNQCMQKNNYLPYNTLCHGGIYVKDWNYLMKKCSKEFLKRYFVYRQTYLGENKGNCNINSTIIKFWSKIKDFGNPDRRPINLLVKYGCIEVATVVRESSFVNKQLTYWNIDDIIT